MSKLTKETVEELQLENDNIIQSIIIKLDAEVPRELRFRQYLDSQRREGINMKESVLRLFEALIHMDLDTPPVNLNMQPVQRVKEKGDIKTTDQKEEVNPSDFDMI